MVRTPLTDLPEVELQQRKQSNINETLVEFKSDHNVTAIRSAGDARLMDAPKISDNTIQPYQQSRCPKQSNVSIPDVPIFSPMESFNDANPYFADFVTSQWQRQPICVSPTGESETLQFQTRSGESKASESGGSKNRAFELAPKKYDNKNNIATRASSGVQVTFQLTNSMSTVQQSAPLNNFCIFAPRPTFADFSQSQRQPMFVSPTGQQTETLAQQKYAAASVATPLAYNDDAQMSSFMRPQCHQQHLHMCIALALKEIVAKMMKQTSLSENAEYEPFMASAILGLSTANIGDNDLPLLDEFLGVDEDVIRKQAAEYKSYGAAHFEMLPQNWHRRYSKKNGSPFYIFVSDEDGKIKKITSPTHPRTSRFSLETCIITTISSPCDDDDDVPNINIIVNEKGARYTQKNNDATTTGTACTPTTSTSSASNTPLIASTHSTSTITSD